MNEPLVDAQRNVWTVDEDLVYVNRGPSDTTQWARNLMKSLKAVPSYPTSTGNGQV